MENISAMDMFTAFRKAIQDMIKDNPKASAKDVLKGLELTQDIVKLFEKRLGKK